LIEAGLRRGNFPTLPAAPLNFPAVEIGLVSIPGGIATGFTGVNKVHIGIDEMAQKTAMYSSPKYSQAALSLYVKLQLASTMIHEVSHTILRAVTLPSHEI
jgi:hypothetical protein